MTETRPPRGRPVGEIQVARSQHGPFERIALTVPTPVGPSALSVYRVGDTLIDAAGTLSVQAVIEALRGRPPARVLCTHQHEDHVGGVEALREAFGALPVHIEHRAVPLVERFDRVPEFRAVFFGHPRPVRDAIGFRAGEDGFEVDVAGRRLRLETVETPGHTPYHVTYLARWEGRVYALTGDLYTARHPNPAWHESSVPCLVRSCRALAAYGEALVMLPTHGRVRPDGAAALGELADWAAREADKVHAAAARLGTRDPDALASAAFGDADAQARQLSGGQYSYANFVRSVLDPVTELSPD